MTTFTHSSIHSSVSCGSRAGVLLVASAISSEDAEAKRSRAIETHAAVASAEAALALAKLDVSLAPIW
jgi:hypothetical protein